MDYTEIAADVLAALQEDGMAMTLRRSAGGTFSPATGSYTGATTTDYPAWGLIQSRTMPQSGNTGERFNGMLVQTDDEFVLLAASGLTVTPAPGDLLVIAAVVYSIVTLIAVKPGGVVLFYRLLVRK
jgi:hypothetical protein